eukprot:12725237-Alexandrium_andersonii.AAC.1
MRNSARYPRAPCRKGHATPPPLRTNAPADSRPQRRCPRAAIGGRSPRTHPQLADSEWLHGLPT